MSKHQWLDEYMKSKAGSTTDYKEEWGWTRYKVGDKLFAATMHPSDKYDAQYADKDLINLKCEEAMSELLRSQYPEILPGFYSDKRVWISVDLDGELPEVVIKELVDESYRLVFSKLTKKLQKELTAQ